jgi:hypothetical protein
MNLQTKVLEPAEAAQHQQTQSIAVVPLLGLSPQQQEFIAVGTQLYYDLLAAIHQERLKINTEMTAADPDQVPVGRTSLDDSSVDTGSSTGVSSGSEQLEKLPDRQKLLERQQELTNRLDLLLNKEVSCSCFMLVVYCCQLCLRGSRMFSVWHAGRGVLALDFLLAVCAECTACRSTLRVLLLVSCARLPVNFLLYLAMCTAVQVEGCGHGLVHRHPYLQAAGTAGCDVIPVCDAPTVPGHPGYAAVAAAVKVSPAARLKKCSVVQNV